MHNIPAFPDISQYVIPLTVYFLLGSASTTPITTVMPDKNIIFRRTDFPFKLCQTAHIFLWSYAVPTLSIQF